MKKAYPIYLTRIHLWELFDSRVQGFIPRDFIPLACSTFEGFCNVLDDVPWSLVWFSF